MYLKDLVISNFRKFGNVTCEDVYESGNKLSFSNRFGGLNQQNNLKVNENITLLVGRNNSGKSTVGDVFRVLCGDKKLEFSDINVDELKEYLDTILEYEGNNIKSINTIDKPMPKITFYFKIFIDNPKVSTNRLFEILPLDISLDKKNEFDFKLEYQLRAEEDFLAEVKKFIERYIKNNRKRIESKGKESQEKSEIKHLSMNAFLRYFESKINEYGFESILYVNDELEKDFLIKDLIDFKIINANKNFSSVDNKSLLTKSIGTIINNKNKVKIKNEFDSLQAELDIINSNLTNAFAKEYETEIVSFLENLKTSEDVSFKIFFDILGDTESSNLLKYKYLDGGNEINSSNFGLGYTNLLYIVAEIIDFINLQKKEVQTNISILYIEEPEAFMHPQLQCKFINYIEDALNKVTSSEKNLYAQVVLSTHSSNIIRSKIINSNSVNYINLLNGKHTASFCKVLDDSFIPQEQNKRKYFIQRLSHELSDIFFSDAIIAVEGDTEKIMLPFYLDNVDEFKNINNKNITIVSGFGRDFKNYYDLFLMLQIPTLVITDLDIKSTVDKEIMLEGHLKEHDKKYSCEIIKNEGKPSFIKILYDENEICTLNNIKIDNKLSQEDEQIGKLEKLLESYNKKDIIAPNIAYKKLKGLPSFNNWTSNYSIEAFFKYKSKESEKYNILAKANKKDRYENIHKNIILTTQNLYSNLEDNSIICTSFEEALIHSNKGDPFLEKIIKEDRTNLFKDKDLYDDSRYIQKKIEHKTDIAIKIIEENYSRLEEKNKIINLPDYIKEGLISLLNKLDNGGKK